MIVVADTGAIVGLIDRSDRHHRQLRDLFEVARVDRRDLGGRERPAYVGIDAWIQTFKQKRSDIVANRCAR